MSDVQPRIRFHSGLADLMVPATSIRPHPDNPNNGDVDEIVASILRVGCYRAIVADQETGYILAGHHLYAALLELGAIMVPVTWADSDDEDMVRILVGDNRIAKLAKIDDGVELQLLERLAKSSTGLSGTGVRDVELERLRAKMERDLASDLKINLGGAEKLIHEIECPNCRYTWVRGQGQE